MSENYSDDSGIEILPFTYCSLAIFADYLITKFGNCLPSVQENWFFATELWMKRFGEDTFMEYRNLLAFLITIGPGLALYRMYKSRIGKKVSPYKLFLYSVGSVETYAVLHNLMVILNNR